MSKGKNSKNKETRKRRTDADRLAAFEAIERLLDEGCKPSQITRLLAQQQKISIRQAERDVEEVVKARRALSSPIEEIAEIIHQNKYLMRKALAAEDYAIANKVLDSRFNYLTKEGGFNDVPSRQKSDLQHELDAFHRQLAKKQAKSKRTN